MRNEENDFLTKIKILFEEPIFFDSKSGFYNATAWNYLQWTPSILDFIHFDYTLLVLKIDSVGELSEEEFYEGIGEIKKVIRTNDICFRVDDITFHILFEKINIFLAEKLIKRLKTNLEEAGISGTIKL